MTHFILIAGVWVNVAMISTLEQYKNYCEISQSSSVFVLRDPRPCEEIIKEIEKVK